MHHFLQSGQVGPHSEPTLAAHVGLQDQPQTWSCLVKATNLQLSVQPFAKALTAALSHGRRKFGLFRGYWAGQCKSPRQEEPGRDAATAKWKVTRRR